MRHLAEISRSKRVLDRELALAPEPVAERFALYE
jgi:hypothetical protein